MFVDNEEYFELEEFKKFGLRAIYTTKKLGDIREEIVREKINIKLGITDKTICSGFQTHSSNIVIIKKDSKPYYEDTDGFLTQRKDVVIFTKYADCLPIYFYDKNKEIFGCVHSGWQGSFKTIGLKALEMMKEKFSSEIEDIVVAFGIGISQKNYEVSEKFYKDFQEKFAKKILKDVFLKNEERYYFDNQKFNKNILLDAGMKKENIITNNLCTFDGKFHSYRRDRENYSGRNGAYIFIDKKLK